MHIYVYGVYIYIYIGLVGRLFANGLGDLGSIPGRVIPKTQKMVIDASFLNSHHYKVRIKGKVELSRKGVVPSPRLRCSSYWKRNLCVVLDYGRQLIYIYIYIPGWGKYKAVDIDIKTYLNTDNVLGSPLPVY